MLVDHDSIVDLKAAVTGQLDARRHAHPDDREAALDLRTVTQPPAPHRALSLERRDRAPGLKVDLLLLVEADRMDMGFLPLGFPAEVVLAQGRALVWPFGLGADQHHASVEASLAELLGRLGPGQPGAHDDKGLL